MSTPRFTPEFKEEAVRHITECCYSVANVSGRPGVPAHRFKRAVFSKKQVTANNMPR